MRRIWRRLAVGTTLLFAAELFASWWLWMRAPTDTLRETYPAFWPFEADRLGPWCVLVIPLFVALGWLQRRSGFTSAQTMVVGVVLAAVVEISTSAWYWTLSSAYPIRDLYESVWYWHRGLPRAQDLHSLSARGYVVDHALPLAVALTVFGGILWVRARSQKFALR